MRIITLCLLLLVAGCQQVKDKSKELAGRAKAKTQQVWEETVDKAFEGLTSGEKASFDSVFHTADSLHVQQLAGRRIDFPAGFYYIFLQYKADLPTIVSYIEQLPTTEETYSDNKMQKSDGQRLFDNMQLVENDYPDEAKELAFFFELRQRKDVQFYKCTRFPRAHSLAFDPKTGILYHHIENLAD